MFKFSDNILVIIFFVAISSHIFLLFSFKYLVWSHWSVQTWSKVTFMLYNLSITKNFSAKNSAFKSDIFLLKSSRAMSDKFDKATFLHALQSIPRGVYWKSSCWLSLLTLSTRWVLLSATIKYELPLNVGLLIILFLCTIEAI